MLLSWTTCCLCRASITYSDNGRIGSRLLFPLHALVSFSCSYLRSPENAKSNSLHSSFTRLCVPQDNRTDPLCGFYSLTDVQAVTLHFIIIGRSHLRERESMARGLGRGRERQTGWLAGVWREEAEGGRGAWQRSWLEREDGGEKKSIHREKKERKPLANI